MGAGARTEAFGAAPYRFTSCTWFRSKVFSSFESGCKGEEQWPHTRQWETKCLTPNAIDNTCRLSMSQLNPISDLELIFLSALKIQNWTRACPDSDQCNHIWTPDTLLKHVIECWFANMVEQQVGNSYLQAEAAAYPDGSGGCLQAMAQQQAGWSNSCECKSGDCFVQWGMIICILARVYR